MNFSATRRYSARKRGRRRFSPSCAMIFAWHTDIAKKVPYCDGTLMPRSHLRASAAPAPAEGSRFRPTARQRESARSRRIMGISPRARPRPPPSDDARDISSAFLGAAGQKDAELVSTSLHAATLFFFSRRRYFLHFIYS